MTVHFQCENCNHPFIAPEEMYGRHVICPQCKSRIQVPEPAEPSEDEFHLVQDGWKVNDRQVGSVAMSERLPVDEPATGRRTETGLVQPKSGTGETETERPAVHEAGDHCNSSQPCSLPVPEKVVISTGKPVFSPTPAETMVLPDIVPDALWYVRPASGGQFGPASMALLLQWKMEGRVTGDSWVWQQGWIDWQQATAVFSDLEEPEPVMVVDPKARLTVTKILSKTEYMKARRRRSALVTIGLSLGTIIVAVLLLALFFVARIQGGG